MPYSGRPFVTPNSFIFTQKTWSGEVEINDETITWEITHWQRPQDKSDKFGTWNIYVTVPLSWFNPEHLKDDDDAPPVAFCDAMPPNLGECTYALRFNHGVRLGVDFAHGYDDKFYSLEEMLKKLNHSFRNWDMTNLPFDIEE